MLSAAFLYCSGKSQDNQGLKVDVIQDENEQVVNILVDGKQFTSYLYTDKISTLKKTTLFPILTANGNYITRGFPLQKRAGERVDHPHHLGMWLNYGDVNGLDYWNNSDAIPPERADQMGTIRHSAINKMESGDGKGVLEVSMNWLRPDGKTIVKEDTRFVFYAEKDLRVIDRISKLTAMDEPVLFKDNKEGMFAVRVTRALEHPSDKPVVLSDAHGQKTDVPVMDNTGVTGHYLSSEGVEGMDVWGKRAKWVALSGEVEGEKVSIVIFDHPDNVGYPTYWHARGYGLFSANPLGQHIFSEGKETLNFSLDSGESTIFRYRTLIVSGETDAGKIEQEYKKFTAK
jgi:hypothetical protein